MPLGVLCGISGLSTTQLATSDGGQLVLSGRTVDRGKGLHYFRHTLTRCFLLFGPFVRQSHLTAHNVGN